MVERREHESPRSWTRRAVLAKARELGVILPEKTIRALADEAVIIMSLAFADDMPKDPEMSIIDGFQAMMAVTEEWSEEHDE
jgi:hypothetical protein